MNVIFRIFKNYKAFAIILFFVGSAIIVFGNLFYQVTKTDIFLISELDKMLDTEIEYSMKEPLGWNVVAKTKVVGTDDFDIVFSKKSFLERSIYYFDTLDGVDYCISKTQELLWSKYDVLFVFCAMLVLALLIFLSYYVLKMFIISHTWKMLALLDNHIVEDVFEGGVYNHKLLKKVSNAIQMLLMIEVLQKDFQKEYSAILYRIKEYSFDILEQEKVSFKYEHELRKFLKIIGN